MFEPLAIYAAIVLTVFIGQIASELKKIRIILETQNNLDKNDSDKASAEP